MSIQTGKRDSWIMRYSIFMIVGLHLFSSSHVEASSSNSGVKQGNIHHIDIKQSGSDDVSEKKTLLPIAHGSHSRNIGNSGCDLFYILVSTIDGKFTALDLHNDGTLAWSVEADSRPLYSSSLANMEMTRDGKKIRIIPSLDGALYQFDGEKVEAVPMSAETLLSSTYKLSDDSMIVGSKDLRNFGINLRTGQVQYSCGSEGCSSTDDKMDEDSHTRDDMVIVLTRTTQVIRSVEIKNGLEKWNFSVGQHQVRMPPNSESVQNNIEDYSDDEDVEESTTQNMPFFNASPHEECNSNTTPEEDGLDNYLRLVVPEGKVVALNKDDVDTIQWEYKLDSPIAKAWLVRNGKIEAMSLFDGRHIPTLGTFDPEELENESRHQPLLYIGSHQKLLYIQPSPKMETVLRSFSSSKRMGHVMDPNVKVSWRPYLNTASYRTPIFSGNRPGLSPGKAKGDENKEETSLTVWHEDYPFDNGFFLFPEFQDQRAVKKVNLLLTENITEEGGIMESIPASLWMYWKEVVAISVSMSIVVHLFLTKFLQRDLHSQNSNSSLNTQTSENSKNSDSNSQSMLVSNDSTPFLHENAWLDGYVSRFATDFECLHCLGKGGFGVVFEAINKVDDMHYAVKRTMLPKSDGAKEKVLREVRALAKLEHIGIVRYFNAWVESPPKGWQEERDSQYQFSSDFSTPFSLSVDKSYSPSPQLVAPKKNKLLQHSFDSSEIIRPDVLEEASLDCGSVSFESSELSERLGHASGSGEFSVHSNVSGRLEDSDPLEHYLGDLHSNFSTSCNSAAHLDISSSLPFSNYTNNSLSRGRHKGEETDDSVVFEHSTDRKSRGNKSTNESYSCEDSIVFLPSDPDSGTGTENATSNVKPDHAIDITLSSRDKDSKDDELKELSKMSEEGTKFFLYIQMQLYRKETLKDWLGNNTLNRGRETILDIFDQIVCAVDYVHSCGLMHRDLKPSNIFFSADRVVKVGDFGLVTALSVQQDQEGQNSRLTSSDRHTAEVGTTLYMSPEQIARKPYDHKVDIFSLGLIFLELWIPFSTQMERIRTLQDAKRQKFPANFSRELPQECELVKKMTSEVSAKRPTAQDVLDHPLLKDLAPTRLSSIRRSRSRTISSNGSNN